MLLPAVEICDAITVARAIPDRPSESDFLGRGNGESDMTPLRASANRERDLSNRVDCSAKSRLELRTEIAQIVRYLT